MDIEEIEEKEFTAPTVEEAVNKACDYFNVTDRRLKYEVIKSTTRGILKSKRMVTIIAKPIQQSEKTKKISESVQESPASEEFGRFVLDETNALLKLMGMNLKAEALKDGERYAINISGPDRMYLMSNDADGLDALQYLMNKIVMNRPDYKKILLDSNGYRSQKEQDLVNLAQDLAIKVKNQRKPYTLDPLNSYERRIVHMALADDKEIITTSVGDGEFKRITISLN
jgi:spoIIIJ-associated protein